VHVRRAAIVLLVVAAGCAHQTTQVQTETRLPARLAAPVETWTAADQAANLIDFYEAVHQRDLTAWYSAAVNGSMAAARRTPAPAGGGSSASTGPSTGRCGGDLPTCRIMQCESGGSDTAQNPSSTASGKWQILDSTWGGYGGYRRARDAPESVQDARARQLWAGGAGRSQWAC
jgi:hypothetical protein